MPTFAMNECEKGHGRPWQWVKNAPAEKEARGLLTPKQMTLEKTRKPRPQENQPGRGFLVVCPIGLKSGIRTKT